MHCVSVFSFSLVDIYINKYICVYACVHERGLSSLTTRVHMSHVAHMCARSRPGRQDKYMFNLIMYARVCRLRVMRMRVVE